MIYNIIPISIECASIIKPRSIFIIYI
jgi:hypothetical protein